MIYKLMHEVNPNYSAAEQVLTSRGIPFEMIHKYLNTTDEDINSPLKLNAETLHEAAQKLMLTVAAEKPAIIIIDSDCDGLTSAALLTNYLHDMFPSWAETKLSFYMHDGKQHGLSDCLEIAKDYPLVLIPDASSNDYDYHQQLSEAGCSILIFDHHEAEKISPYATVINNQLSDYPNKFFSGVGITWQFCRYLDIIGGNKYADRYRDLVALGNMADMMDIRELETKHLITTGFKDENVHNPFIRGMAEKNAFKLGAKITPMGAAFYIAPFVNAMVRSGTQEEKILLYRSMINQQAFKKIPSNKRGHKPGEEETVLEQALRTATNVKNRQTRVQDASLELLEKLIERNHLLEHRVLMFLLEPGQVDRNVAGLIANKFMSKYQRPCCILTKVTENQPDGTVKTTYQGSARGCDLAGITTFKDICESTGYAQYAQGHQGAFGLSILASDIENFLNATDELLKDMSTEPMYYVDYIYDGANVNPQNILDIGFLEDLWGQGLVEPYIAIKDLKIKKEMVTVYAKDTNTLKITLPNKINIMLFKAPDELCNKLQNQNTGYIQMDIVGRCKVNNFNGYISPQVFIEGYDITGECKYEF